METINLEYLCKAVRQCVLDTAEMIRRERNRFDVQTGVETKGHSNFVTYIDKLSEAQLVESLLNLLPEAGFIAEEGTSDKKGVLYNWVIDPIDGTTNFIHGLPPYAISVGLMRGPNVVLGVVYEITRHEMFYAWEGSKAWFNDHEIRVSDHAEHQEALIATGFPYYDLGKLEPYIECMKEVMDKTSGVRRLGSAAVDICYVACGRFEAFWEYGLQAWDVAAGALILQQAGGRVSDFNGGNDFIFNHELVASNHRYYDKFYEIVHRHLGNHE